MRAYVNLPEASAVKAFAYSLAYLVERFSVVYDDGICPFRSKTMANMDAPSNGYHLAEAARRRIQ